MFHPVLPVIEGLMGYVDRHVDRRSFLNIYLVIAYKKLPATSKDKVHLFYIRMMMMVRMLTALKSMLDENIHTVEQSCFRRIFRLSSSKQRPNQCIDMPHIGSLIPPITYHDAHEISLLLISDC